MMNDEYLHGILSERTEPIEERVERLRGIWGDDHAQIRHHVYRGVYSDVRYHSTHSDPDHEAASAALLAVSLATEILRPAPTPASPADVGAEVVVELAKDIITLVENEDSAQGYLEYAWSPTKPGRYDVRAVLRTGNSIGQGGVIIIDGSTVPSSDHDGGDTKEKAHDDEF